MLQVRRNRDDTMLRIDLGAFVYAYSIPVTKASNSESAVSAYAGICKKTLTCSFVSRGTVVDITIYSHIIRQSSTITAGAL
jgi:hypothetical protein